MIILLLFFRKNRKSDEALTSKGLYPIVGSNNNSISEKIKILKLITNNNEWEYKGAENCLLKDRSR